MSKKEKRTNPLIIIVMIVAISVLAYSGYQLYTILDNYRRTDEEYQRLNEDYTKKKGTSEALTEDPDVWPKYEDAEVPLEIDWEALKNINPDVVGWIYVEAEEKISYPICWKKGDNDYYLHRSYEGDSLYAGSIFLEGLNNPDFADPVNIVYGHNMKNGSMFAALKNLKDQETYQEHPYFWILTPNGNYRYHIYAIFQTSPYSEVYQLFAKRGSKFLAWEQTMQSLSEVVNSVPLFEDDSTVILSTCESDHEHRNVVIGRCVSTVQPTRINAEYVSVGTKGNTEADLAESEAASNVMAQNENQGTEIFGENDLGF